MKYWNKKRLNKTFTKLKTHKNKKISDKDFQIIYKLLESGYSLQTALEFLPSDKKWLLSSLENGIDFMEFLKEQKTDISNHIYFFSSITTLSDAIKISHVLYGFKRKMQKTLYTKSCYPCILLICSFFIIKLFSNLILPQILNGFSFQQIPVHMITSLKVLNYIMNIFLITLVIIICIIVFSCINQKTQAKILCSLGTKFTCVKNYCSYIFANYLNELEKSGISTYQSIQYLEKVDLIWLRQLSNRLYQELIKGNDFISTIEQEMLFSKDFIHCMKLRAFTEENQSPFELFFIQQQEYWNLFLKKFTFYLLCTTYIFIGITVFLTFQIMLLPLQFIESF